MYRKKYTEKQKAAYYRRIRGNGAYVSKTGKKPSRSRVLVGNGGYYNSKFVKTMNKYVPKGSLSAAGSALGTYFGGPVGTGIGGAAGGLLSKILGFGDYRVERNSVWSQMKGNDPPKIVNSISDRSTLVKHREYICDILAPNGGAFTIQTFPIQPGLFTSFPWLNSIANNYQQYKVHGMVFEFKTMSADALSSTNPALGSVIMATNYDSVQPAFINKIEMENTEFCSSAKPSESMCHPIECKYGLTSINDLYVRAGSPPSNADLRMYDLGLFSIATVGGQQTAQTNVGELWVTYEIEFLKPLGTQIAGVDVISDHFQLASVTNAHPLGAAQPSGVTGSSLGGSITGFTTYNFPAVLQTGVYLVVLQYVGGSTALTLTNAPTYTNCKALQLGNGDSAQWNNSGGSFTTGMMFSIVQVTGLNATIAYSASNVFPTSVTGADLFVTEFDASIVT